LQYNADSATERTQSGRKIQTKQKQNKRRTKKKKKQKAKTKTKQPGEKPSL